RSPGLNSLAAQSRRRPSQLGGRMACPAGNRSSTSSTAPPDLPIAAFARPTPARRPVPPLLALLPLRAVAPSGLPPVRGRPACLQSARERIQTYSVASLANC